MNLRDATALITGASGGIGAAIAAEIVGAGGRALLSGRDERALLELARSIDPAGGATAVVAADVARPEDRRRLIEAAKQWRGGVNVLINNAGVANFGLFVDERPEDLERAFAINVLAPMHLCRALLPHLSRLPRAHIVNIGSVFGAIGYPGQAAYCATKFALRGFSEALRRELSDGNVRVHYLAPRATRTRFNSTAVEKLNQQLGVAVDPPERVAARLRKMLEHEHAHAVIGWPEKLFARLNALLPRLVDGALAKQLPAIQQHARAAHATRLVQNVSRKAS